MKTSFTNNQEYKLVEVLSSRLSSADEVKIAVAFLRRSGLQLLQNNIEQCLRRNGSVELLVGLDFRTTEPAALRHVLEMKREFPNIGIYCFSDPLKDDTPVFHPKMYLMMEGKSSTAIIGSSNLTAGGLRDNVEINLVLEGDIVDEIFASLHSTYFSLKFKHHRFEPNSKYIDSYEETYNTVKKKGREANAIIRKEAGKLKAQEKELPKPILSEKDLVGWQRIVYRVLPDEPFQTRDIYQHASAFSREYPQNQNIEAKIRQVLQQLRDRAILKPLGTGRWKKTSSLQ